MLWFWFVVILYLLTFNFKSEITMVYGSWYLEDDGSWTVTDANGDTYCMSGFINGVTTYRNQRTGIMISGEMIDTD